MLKRLIAIAVLALSAPCDTEAIPCIAYRVWTPTRIYASDGTFTYDNDCWYKGCWSPNSLSFLGCGYTEEEYAQYCPDYVGWTWGTVHSQEPCPGNTFGTDFELFTEECDISEWWQGPWPETFACGGKQVPPPPPPPPPPDCVPQSNNQPEVCADGVDNNSNCEIDEGCRKPEEPDSCGVLAGDDPIHLASQSVITEPFTDFEVDTEVARLGISRSYSSNDRSYVDGIVGHFGQGWRHDWQAWLSCAGGVCTVADGTSGYQFTYSRDTLSSDGSETWQIYEARTGTRNPHVLARRPSGEWILFLADGTEWHFRQECDGCVAPDLDEYCAAPEDGGKARIVKIVNSVGRTVRIDYDRFSGVLFRLTDELGHYLEAKTGGICGSTLATELIYDGTVVARYEYVGEDLVAVTDADGATLRSYSYDDAGSGRLLAVHNESDTTIAEFAYDSQGRAIGVIDQKSSVGVNYDAPDGIRVTEYFAQASATSVRTIADGRLTSVSDDCACGPPRIFEYSEGRLVRTCDAQDHVTSYTYDELGRRTGRAESTASCCGCALDSGGQSETRTYSLSRPIASGVSLPLSVVTQYATPSTNWTYLGRFTTRDLDFDPTPKPSDPPGYVCQEEPLPVGGVPCREVVSGYVRDVADNAVFTQYVTFKSYDGFGRLTRVYGPVDLSQPIGSDWVPLEERTYWPSDEQPHRRGRLKTVRRFATSAQPPHVTSYDYDMFGPFQVTAPDGAVTTILRDGRGRTLVTLHSGGAQQRITYYGGAAPLLVVTQSEAVRYVYGELGRVIRVEHLSDDPTAPNAMPILRWSENYAYDAAGNRVSGEWLDSTGSVTSRFEREYDVHRRVVREMHPEDATWISTRTYDASGFLTAVIDEQNRTTAFTPAGVNRVGRVDRSGVDANGSNVTAQLAAYGYVKNNVARFVDGLGATVDYRHDDFDRVTWLHTPALKGGRRYFEYDARGNILRRWDNYTSTSYAYDGLDRVTSQTAVNNEDGTSISYAFRYDEFGAVGRLTTVVEPERTVSYSYDSSDLLIRETVEENGAAPLVTRYGYDVDGIVSSVTYPSGLEVRYLRDPITGAISGIVSGAGDEVFASNATYYPEGATRSLTFGNGQHYAYSVTLRGEPKLLESGPLSLAYSMSPAGNVESVTDTSDTQSGCQRTTTRQFKYDLRDRIVDSPGWLTYSYDAGGHRNSEVVEGQGATYTYTSAWTGSTFSSDRLGARQSQGARTHAFLYDRQTNISGIARYDSTGNAVAAAVCLWHDAFGRLATYGGRTPAGLVPDGIACTNESEITDVAVRFSYDHRNLRVARWDAATQAWTRTVFDANGHPLSELRLSGSSWTPIRDYVWLNGRPIAQREYSGTARTYWLHADHLGMPRAMTNASGQIVWAAIPRPYGDVTEVTTTDPSSGATVVTNLRLPGQYDERLLASLGLQGPYYNWNRWYLPSVGRYLELDPIALTGGFNTSYGVDWYGYADQNPVRWTDPSGLSVELYCESIQGHGFVVSFAKHCFVRAKCDGCYEKFDVTLELWGPSADSGGRGRPHEDPFDPNFNGRGSTGQYEVSGNGPMNPGPGGGHECAAERCVRDRFRQLSKSLPLYNGFGPNSNTFARQILEGCGLQGDPPWTAKGWGHQ
jgi:RHS repeat-associated protein